MPADRVLISILNELLRAFPSSNRFPDATNTLYCSGLFSFPTLTFIIDEAGLGYTDINEF